MKQASGVAPVPAMLKMDMPLGLGTDGSASNNDLSIWEEIDTTAQGHKLISGDPKVVSALQAFAMARIGGAYAPHMQDQVGSLEVGKRADLAVLDWKAINQLPLSSIDSALVCAAKACDLLSLVGDGQVVPRDRQLLTLDEPAIAEEALTYRRRNEVRLGLAPGASEAR